jgi:broad specificity phosphatase PhoE
VLRTAARGAALAAFPALLGVAPGPGPLSPGVPVTAGRGKVIMVIRHGEKPSKAQVPFGVNLAGQPDTRSLTEQGWVRAASLVELFVPRPGSGRVALPRPSTIYASGEGDGGVEGNRPRQTVRPLAMALRVPVDTSFSRGDEARLVAHAASQPGPTLICWQHGQIPTMAAAFGRLAPAAPRTWPDDRYDVVWTFTSTGTGWRFGQVPERLLPGDGATGIV